MSTSGSPTDWKNTRPRRNGKLGKREDRYHATRKKLLGTDPKKLSPHGGSIPAYDDKQQQYCGKTTYKKNVLDSEVVPPCLTDHTSKKHKLYEEVTLPTARGQKAAQPNIGIHVGLMNTSVGITGFRDSLSAAGIPVGSKRGMQNSANYVGSKTVYINRQDMKERRSNLVRLNKLKGFTSDHKISVEGDCRYNNRLFGGNSSTPLQPATQAVYTIAENETPKKEIIGIYTANKLCKKAEILRSKGEKITCPDHGGKCTANLKTTDSIGNEGLYAEKCVKEFQVDEDKLNIGYFTTDGDSHATDGATRAQTGSIENLRDTRHFSKSQQKAIEKVSFSLTMFPGKNKSDRQKVQRRFAIDIKQRCHLELDIAHRQLAGDITKIVRKMTYTIDSIVACVSGNCSTLCQRHSFVCSGRRIKAWKPAYLPADSVLKMKEGDKELLRKCLELRLGKTALLKTKLNTNTQKVESVNRAYTRTNPKQVTFYRNFEARIHSAAHMLNKGILKSTVTRCQLVGAPLTGRIHALAELKARECEDRYHATRKKTTRYRSRRNYLRK
ncbi:uncharacterized protein LOC121367109, partial [Gigantopelta aegis]|uniref:uncharacterized protein LOC121367109 n=1 Tax=Gigantopelta aegis TaxID=1735272 RepID=UPI001B8897AD